MSRRTAALVVALALAAGGCGRDSPAADDGTLTVITTTEILADVARNVGGDRVAVTPVVPPGADPHSYEPSPRDAGRISEADVAITNHLLLEPRALIKAIDANVPDGIPNVALAEAAEGYGARVIPLVEDLGLDVLWLGLRVRGEGQAKGATRSSEIVLSASAVEGPGELMLYLTDALGRPEIYVDSSDGLGAVDRISLPPAAHTHLNWAFTEPGSYRLTLDASLTADAGTPQPLGQATFAFAVGVDPAQVARGKRVLGKGHTDLTVDLDQGRVYAYSQDEAGAAQQTLAAQDVVIDVPAKAIATVPDDSRFTFLGAAGARIHQLPQAVLGKHVHGEIDPHLWEDAANVKAYAQVVRDTLTQADPAGKEMYAARTSTYLEALSALDEEMRDKLATIAPERRKLITTHDAFGYLAEAYGLDVAGFVVPNPAQEPSAAEVRKLSDTIRDLQVPAVFVEPHLEARADVLRQVAADQKVAVCKLYGDSFDEHATSVVSMLRHNADELVRCLGPGA